MLVLRMIQKPRIPPATTTSLLPPPKIIDTIMADLSDREGAPSKRQKTVLAEHSLVHKHMDSWSDQIGGQVRPMCALDPVIRAELCALLGLRRNQLVARIPNPVRELGVQVDRVKLSDSF
ncbi:hypothetical protein AgCh_028257 [Apium graveolens]